MRRLPSLAFARSLGGAVCAVTTLAASVGAGADVFFFDTPAAVRGGRPRNFVARQRPAAAVAVAQVQPALIFGAPMVPQGGDQQEAIIQQLIAQLRQPLQVELSFANRVCKFDDAERAKFVAASLAALDEEARAQAKNQPGRQNMVVFMRGGAVNMQAVNDPSTLGAEIASRGVERIASPEKLAAYRRERKAREEFRRDADIDGLVGVLDEQLNLTDEQRKKIATSLAEKWQAGWSFQIMQVVRNQQYFPSNVPAACVQPHLSAKQAMRWERIPKVNFGGGFQQLQGLLGGAIGLIDDVPLEPMP